MEENILNVDDETEKINQVRKREKKLKTANSGRQIDLKTAYKRITKFLVGVQISATKAENHLIKSQTDVRLMKSRNAERK